MQDQLRGNAETLHEQRAKMLEQQRLIRDRAERLVERHRRLFKTFGGGKRSANVAHMLETLQKYGSRLEYLNEKLEADSARIAEQAEFARQRTLFLKREERHILDRMRDSL
jgi:hypothetical protein